jgi:hypothetical protein
MKQLSVTLSLLILYSISKGQARGGDTTALNKRGPGKDSTALSGPPGNSGASMYPMFRRASVESDFIGNNNITTKLKGQDFIQGKLHYNSRIRVTATVPVYESGKNSFIAGVNYAYLDASLTGVTNNSPYILKNDFHNYNSTISLSLGYTRRDSLFHRPVIFSAVVTGSSYQLSSLEKVSFFGFASIFIKQTPTTVITVGVAGVIDKSSPLPFAPAFGYWHKFSRSPWELSVNFPVQMVARRPVLTKGWLSFGSEFGGISSYLDIHNPSLPRKAEYRELSIKTGASFEYPLNKYILFGIKGGMMNIISSRVMERNKSSKDYFISAGNSTLPYGTISLTLLPFKQKK